MSKKIKGTELISEEIDVLKGILMCLIILGHNKLFTLSTGSFSYLYSFHVSCFFVLSVLLNDHKINRKHIVNKFKNYYYPYTVFFIILCVLNAIRVNGFIFDLNSIKKITYAFFIADMKFLRPITGFSYLWFMPAIFYFYLLTVFYNSFSPKAKYIYIGSMVILILLLGNYRIIEHYTVPCSLEIVIFLLPISIVIKNIIIRLVVFKQYLLFSGTIFILMSSHYYYASINIPAKQFPIFSLTEYIMYVFFITSAFLFFHGVAKILKNNKAFVLMGRHSMEVYLIHNLINFLVIDVLFDSYFNDVNLYMLIFISLQVFIFVASISLFIAYSTSHNRFFRKLYYI